MTRTTVNIDAPILQDLKKIQKGARKSLGRLISELLAEALANRRANKDKKTEFEWISKPMGARIDIADKERLLAELDRDTTR